MVESQPSSESKTEAGSTLDSREEAAVRTTGRGMANRVSEAEMGCVATGNGSTSSLTATPAAETRTYASAVALMAQVG